MTHTSKLVAYSHGTTALPLGARAGVPSRAATVELSKVLNDKYPEMAKQVERPSELLHRPENRPEKLKKPGTVDDLASWSPPPATCHSTQKVA